MTERVDVLIVGGGPAGLAAAQMAAAGGSVLVAHRDREIGRPVRTSGASWLRDIEKLDIPRHLYHPLDSLSFYGPTTEAAVQFGADRPVVLDVTGTYRHLAELAGAAGARVECGLELQAVVSQSADEVVCRLASPGGMREITARYVVDASGHRRAVLSSIGAAGRPERIGVGSEYECEDRSEHRSRAVLFVGDEFAPSGYGWVFPTRRGTVRVGVGVIRPDSVAAPAVLLDRFMGSDAARRMCIRVGDVVEKHSGIIPSDGPFEKLIYGRVIAVGDSAGQALPLVGEGIRYCIQSGRKAGAALAGALRSPGNDERWLTSYQDWWRHTHYRPFKLAQQVNERISRYHDPVWDEKVSLLGLLNARMMAAMLRMEMTPAMGLRIALSDPAPVARYALNRLGKRLRRLIPAGDVS